MTRINAAEGQVRQASGLPAVLDAACEAFQEILTALRGHEDGGGRWFIPFAMAATSAADGRDALLFAPSLPAARKHQLGMNGSAPSQDLGQLAGEVAALTVVLAERLIETAEAAAEQGDRDACELAAVCAGDIGRMLTGTGP